MSRNKPSANYLIVTTLLKEPTPISDLKRNIPSFYKRLWELEKMGFIFEELIDTNTGCLYFDIIGFPNDATIDRDKQIIKVGNYWRNIKIDRQIREMEDDEFDLVYEKYCNSSEWKWYSIKETIKFYISKLFK